jgi:hypothetical protein
MAFFLRQLTRYAAHKLANDPKVRAKAADVARNVAREAGHVVRDEDPARAAGRAVRRAMNKLQGER